MKHDETIHDWSMKMSESNQTAFFSGSVFGPQSNELESNLACGQQPASWHAAMAELYVAVLGLISFRCMESSKSNATFHLELGNDVETLFFQQNRFVPGNL